MKRRITASLTTSLLASLLVVVPSARPAVSQDACRAPDDAAALPPGEHVAPISSTLHASGGVGSLGGFDITITYDAAVRLDVGPDGDVRGASADVTLAFDGAITGVPGVGGDVSGSGTGTLTLARSSDREIVLGGEMTGLGELAFSGMVDHSAAAASSGSEQLTLRIDEASCQQVAGEATSQLMDDSAARFRAAGLGAEREPMTWSVGEAASPEVQAIRDELAAAEQLGTSGPDRRSATSRLAKALDRIKALPEAEQTCLWHAWRQTVSNVLQRRIDADIAVVSSIEPTSADMGPLRGAIASLLDSERQYQLLGLDACSAGDRRPAFDAIAGAISRFLDRAIEDGRVVDVIRLMRDFQLFGDVSPALAAEADAAIEAGVEDWLRTTTTNLKRVAQEAEANGDRECSLTDGHTVRKAIAAAKHYAILGGDAPYDDIVRHAEVLGCVS